MKINLSIKLNLLALLILPYLCAGFIYYMGAHFESTLSAHAPFAIERVKTENDTTKLKELVVVAFETIDSTNQSLVDMHKSYTLILIGVAILFSINIISIYSYIKNASNKSLNSDAEKRRAG